MASVPDEAKQDLTVAPPLGSLPAGSTDSPGAQEEPVPAKLGTQGPGEQHPACWHGPGCRHPRSPSLPGHGEGGGVDKVGGQARFWLQEASHQGSQWPHSGLSLEGDPSPPGVTT